MIYNTLHSADITISKFGFGASPFGNIFNKPVTDDEASRCVQTAIEHGINYFDVAPYYGNGIAEQKLATALGKQSKNIVLSTKVGRYGKNKFDFSTSKIENSIYHSLELFSRDYLDIIFCHDIEYVDPNIILETALPTLAKLKEKGIIRAIGISGYPLDKLYTIAHQFPIDLILSYAQYTLINHTLTSYQKKFQDLSVDIINASPFDMGLLTHHNCPHWHPASNELKEKIKTIKNHCQKETISLEKIAFQHTYSYKGCLSHLTGIGSYNNIQTCLQWHKEPLEIKDLQKIQTMLTPPLTPLL